jgi:outer membrane cobalamin receptor
MKKKLQKITIILVFMFLNVGLFAQGYVKGIVTDATTNETLIGASVYIKGTTTGATTDAKGAFKFEATVGTKTIVTQYVGYLPIETEVTVKKGETSDLGTVQLSVNQVGLKEVVIIASVAISRKTPVAMSTLEPKMIEEKMGTQEFPEILKATPGVYATKQGGGYGDSRINLRGFESANTAVMINGVPVNDMEWGGVYWSNWAGLGDVTRSMQVQRGLGASKVSAPSLGGSINILTNTTDVKRGGAVSYGTASNGYSKIGFSVSTGLTDKNWAITLLGAKTTGKGYIQGTEFESYSYFVNVSKKINASHSLSFTAFGAPQWHNQRNNGDKLLISEWQKQPNTYKYNASYGFDMNGQRKVSSGNVYNKPQISLNHFWTMSPNTSLSTVLYSSIGDGYGTSGQGYTSTDRGYWYGSTLGIPNTTFRTADGTFDYGGVYAYNKASTTGSKMTMSNSINQHKWYGLISTYTTKLRKNLDFYGGIDFRYYKGTHTNVLTDLYGGSFFIDATSARPLLSDQSWKTKKLGVGDIVYRDYDGFVFSQGIFMQAEYNKDALSAFVSLSGSNTSQWRYDRFYYDSEFAKSETFNALGYCAKGGANYNLNDNHNVFANIGVISRAPFFSGGAFLQSTTSNAINPNAINEKAFSTELGYGFRSQYFTANVNLYNTKWMNKTIVRSSISQPDPAVAPKTLSVNMEGVDALHQGIEIDLVSKPIRNLEIKGMVSLGNWNWASNATGYLYTDNGQPADANGNEVPFGSPEHVKMNVNLKDIHVGNSAQTTVALGARYEMLRGFSIGLDGNYYGRNYSYFSINPASTGYSDLNFDQPWQIPDAYVFDLSMSYRFKMGGLDASLVGNIQNLFNAEYISDATTGVNNDWETSQVFYGFGRTFSTTLKVKF